MNNDLAKHKLLGLLSYRFAFAEEKNGETLGISYEELFKKMKCDDIELRIISSELYENKEIGYIDDDIIVGLHAFQKGVVAYSSNKYKSRFWRHIFGSIKLSVNIIIPVFAFILSCISLYISVKTNMSIPKQEQSTAKEQSDKQKEPKSLLSTDTLTFYQNGFSSIE